MTQPDETLSPDHAAAVWRRAAQLQAEAAQRLDERSRALAVRSERTDADPHDFTLEEVRAAALEAGIAPEFVALAVAEAGADPEATLTPAGDRAATRFLGVSQRTLEVARTIERPAAQVYDAMQRLLPGNPWYLVLRDSAGDPLSGGILVFDVPAHTMGTMTPIAYHAATVDVKQVQVMLRPVPGGQGAACELVVSAGLTRSVRRNLKAGTWTTGIFGVVGGGAGAGIGVAAGVAGGILALPAVAGAAVLGGGIALLHRTMYRHSLRRLGEELARMLQGVDAHARTGGGFVPAPRPAQDDGATAMAAIITTTIT